MEFTPPPPSDPKLVQRMENLEECNASIHKGMRQVNTRVDQILVSLNKVEEDIEELLRIESGG